MPKPKKPTAAVPEVVDVTPESGEMGLLRQESGSILEMFQGKLAAFLGKSDAMESNARRELQLAKDAPPPQNGLEAQMLQGDIRRTSGDIKAAEEHYEALTGGLFRLHRHFTGRRDRIVTVLKEAKDLKTRRFNAYTDAERRRAEEETRANQRAEEERARAEQAERVAQLEAQALKAEADSPELSARERSFVDHYVQGHQPDVAAGIAGFKDPFKAAARLLAAEKIALAVTSARDAIAARKQAAAVKAEPPEVREVDEVKPDVPKGGTRTTWSAELFDEQKLIAAILAGEPGIPRSLLRIDPVALNDEARQLQTGINRWPGVRAVKKTGVV